MQTGELLTETSGAQGPGPDAGDVERWCKEVRERAGAALDGFVRERCAEYVHGFPGADLAGDVLVGFASGGKFLRSTFAYLGWLCGAGGGDGGDSDAAVRAAASMELLHAFALLHDDVMDRSPTRRGQAAAHVRLAQWYRGQDPAGDAAHFGESAAILLGDLCLVWAERMLRECGLGADALGRGWAVYDTLRGELAVGQFADLVYDARQLPPLNAVLAMSRRKSGNYTVRRPLELGAALAGCGAEARAVLGRYGELVGEAFQLRDDLLGVFGQPAVTGKPNAGDLREHKATSVVALAADLATPAQRGELERLAARARPTEPELARWRALIEETGAIGGIEAMIGSHVSDACAALAGAGLGQFAEGALRELAVRATSRAW
ncbi:MAG TPA: polyprenyl synthetase family protein [Trebonia sp.]|nr:polyprenyl synthetase family protein [Trebonia sp.]